MKSFIQYIAEKRDPQWMKSASVHIFNSVLHLPLTTKMLKRILGKLPRMTVFHVTNRAFLDDMIKMQGKKKSISAATGFDSSVINSGINVAGGLVFELDADVLVSAPRDIMSRPDKTGRRWVELSELMPIRHHEVARTKIEKEAVKELHAIMKKYDPKGVGNLNDTMSNWAQSWFLERSLKGLSTKEAGKVYHNVVKDYMDAMERIMSKNADVLRDAFFNHAINVKGTPLGGVAWDEIVVNNTKIKSILIDKASTMRSFNFDVANQGFVEDDEIEPRYNAFLADLDRRRIPYQVFSSPRELAAAVLRKRKK